MNWQEVVVFVLMLIERFEPQQKGLPAVPLDTPEAMFHSHLELETRTSGRIDELIHQLSRGEKTETTSDEAYFLTQRLRFGLAIAQALATPSGGRAPFVPVPMRVDRESILTWLLIDVWRSTTSNIWVALLRRSLDKANDENA